MLVFPAIPPKENLVTPPENSDKFRAQGGAIRRMDDPMFRAAIFALLFAVCLPLLAFRANASDEVSVTTRMTPSETAKAIDELFAASWASQQVVPADRATDSEFLRRVYLDLAGRIPAVSEVREFLASEETNKRVLVVEQLLDGPAYVRNFTIVWRNALIPQAGSQLQFRGLIPGFDAWLWTHISQNTPYDQLVRTLLTAPLGSAGNRAGVLNAASSPDAFYVVRELKPENLATGTSRAFLGVRLDCAQCHDHPFDSWKQHQFWNLAAFYAGFDNSDQREAPDAAMQPTLIERAGAQSIRIPGTEKTVSAVFLTGLQPEWSDKRTSREVLADWVTDRANPYFAKMVANRLWAQFFGQGIVQPVDDFSENNPPTHPEVLELLASQLIAHDFDLQFLIRTITSTRVYQTTSLQNDASQSDSTQFSRAALRGLTPEQFFDSLAEAVGFYQPYRSDNPFVAEDSSVRGRFLELYRDEAESPLQRETTILQALAMMNGEFVSAATSPELSQTLRAVVEFPMMSNEQRLETLFLAALGRFPEAEEQLTFSEYISEGDSSGNTSAAFSDIFWALLNSSEFLLNH